VHHGITSYPFSILPPLFLVPHARLHNMPRREGTIALFDVDGTLTVPRKVCVACARSHSLHTVVARVRCEIGDVDPPLWNAQRHAPTGTSCVSFEERSGAGSRGC
jgi:hypothetical protein